MITIGMSFGDSSPPGRRCSPRRTHVGEEDDRPALQHAGPAELAPLARRVLWDEGMPVAGLIACAAPTMNSSTPRPSRTR